jgi:membrane-associated protein
MTYFKFLFYNVFGGIIWVALFVFGGYFFGNIPIVKKNFTIVIFIIIMLSFVPMAWEWWKHKRSKKK